MLQAHRLQQGKQPGKERKRGKVKFRINYIVEVTINYIRATTINYITEITTRLYNRNKNKLYKRDNKENKLDTLASENK